MGTITIRITNKLTPEQLQLKKLEQSYFKDYRKARRTGSIGKAEKEVLKIYARREWNMQQLLPPKAETFNEYQDRIINAVAGAYGVPSNALTEDLNSHNEVVILKGATAHSSRPTIDNSTALILYHMQGLSKHIDESDADYITRVKQHFNL